MALTVAFFRAIALLSISRRKSKRVSTVKKPINFLPVFLPVVVFLVIFQRLVDLGILGSRLKNFSTEYGGSLLSSLFRARAEFPVSMQIFGQMPFLGYGTVSDPLNHLRMNILVSDHLSFGEQGFFVLRLFGDGFDVHSWAFNLIFRARMVNERAKRLKDKLRKREQRLDRIVKLNDLEVSLIIMPSNDLGPYRILQTNFN